MEKTSPVNHSVFITCVVALFSLVTLSQTTSLPVVDWDEDVYLYLSQHMSWTLDNYSTRGSRVENFPWTMYRAPVYHHPPLYPYLVKIFSVLFSPFIAARLVNAILYGLSLFLVYGIASRLTDFYGALTALLLWIACPIHNLEVRLMHLDYPMAVFFLAGAYLLLQSRDRQHETAWLAASGTAFGLGMLFKYTGPLFILSPLLLYAGLGLGLDRGPLRRALAFAPPLLLGFSWWAYIFVTFGSLSPGEFVDADGGPVAPFTPYLKAIARRDWYHLWLYFLAICPLFILYVSALLRRTARALVNYRHWFGQPLETRALISLNLGVASGVLLFSAVNARYNDLWVFRHIIPIFPVIYISIGCWLPALWKGLSRNGRSALSAAIVLTLFTMAVSTGVTLENYSGLRPRPVLLFWLGLKDYFH